MRAGRWPTLRALLLVSADAVLGDHFDAVLDQLGVQAGDLLLGHLDLLQCGGDLLEGEVAALAAERDQRLQLLRPHRLLARILIQPLRDRLQRLDFTASAATLFPSRGPAPTLRLGEV